MSVVSYLCHLACSCINCNRKKEFLKMHNKHAIYNRLEKKLIIDITIAIGYCKIIIYSHARGVVCCMAMPVLQP